MAKKTNWASSAFEPTAVVPDSLTSGASKQILNLDHWREDFQDLSGYCNIGLKMEGNLEQQSAEELNTPIIVQDDFDFNVQPTTTTTTTTNITAGGRFADINEDIEPCWGPQNDNEINITETEKWDNVNDWLLLSNNPPDMDDREDMIEIGVDIDAVDEASLDVLPEEKPQLEQLNQQQNLINSDILLSQSADFKPQTLPLINELNNEQSHLDVISIYKPEPQYCDQSNLQQQLRQPQQQVIAMKNVNNNNYSTINMNNVFINSNNGSNPFSVPIKKQEQLKDLILKPSKTKSAFVNGGSLKNRHDAVNNKWISIFKSEEPIISESKKQLSLCTTMNNSVSNVDNIVTVKSSSNNLAKVTGIVITPDSIATTSTGSNNIKLQTKYVNSYSDQLISSSGKTVKNYGGKSILNDTYVIPDPIKAEPMDSADIEVKTINEHTTDNTVRLNAGKQLKLSQSNTKKIGMGLKLDIDSAAKLVATDIITPTITPTTSSALCNMTHTPDVLRLFNNGEFDLLSYISGDGNGDNLSVCASRTASPLVIDKRNVPISKSQQPLKPRAVIVEKLESAYEPSIITLPIVKEEDEEQFVIKKEEPMEESRTSFEDSLMSSTPSDKVTAIRAKRKRRAKKSDDMESDLSNLSDFVEEDDEKHDKTFTLSPYRRKRTISTASRTSTELSRSYDRVPHYGKQRKLSRETDSSDHESIVSSSDRYRELRDRNNEASRRSRLNRKSREMEMKEQALHLEDENRRLKAKADEMERLVKRLRDGLMRLVLKNKN